MCLQRWNWLTVCNQRAVTDTSEFEYQTCTVCIWWVEGPAGQFGHGPFSLLVPSATGMKDRDIRRGRGVPQLYVCKLRCGNYSYKFHQFSLRCSRFNWKIIWARGYTENCSCCMRAPLKIKVWKKMTWWRKSPDLWEKVSMRRFGLVWMSEFFSRRGCWSARIMTGTGTSTSQISFVTSLNTKNISVSPSTCSITTRMVSRNEEWKPNFVKSSKRKGNRQKREKRAFSDEKLFGNVTASSFFTTFSVSISGVLDVDEIMVAFRELGVHVERPEAERLLKRWETLWIFSTWQSEHRKLTVPRFQMSRNQRKNNVQKFGRCGDSNYINISTQN